MAETEEKDKEAKEAKEGSFMVEIRGAWTSLGRRWLKNSHAGKHQGLNLRLRRCLQRRARNQRAAAEADCRTRMANAARRRRETKLGYLFGVWGV